MKLGQKGKDVVSGFEGVITGIVQYLTGCNQVLLTGPMNKDGETKTFWVDETRVEITDEKILKLPGNKAEVGPSTAENGADISPSRMNPPTR